MGLAETKWIILFQGLYTVILVACCLRIVYDTRSVSKTLAYLLFAIFVPVVGIVFYFSFGINYRKRKLYNKKLIVDESVKYEFQEFIQRTNQQISELEHSVVRQYQGLTRLLSNRKVGSINALPNNEIKLLINGEELFPVLLSELQKATECIHIEYYIYEDDVIGNRIKDLLIEKAMAGVKVRFIYDDFGSNSIRKTIVRELIQAGIQAHPFNRIKLVGFANRLNYRNHRKIVIIDGKTSFTGGINISDRYINHATTSLYWRDTHLMIKGYASLALQQVFLSDWNFCVSENVLISKEYFPAIDITVQNPVYAQIVSSGPDSDLPNILYSIVQSINLAREEILLTTPYYIPDVSLQESLVMAALSGINVKLLVPKQGDSRLVNLATQSYFDALLRAGVKIYLYTKGFVHAKSYVIDRQLASVSTANFDVRSFDLNFEVSAIVYDERVASQLAETFDKDLADAEELVLERWNKRSRFRKIIERIVRLFSPFM